MHRCSNRLNVKTIVEHGGYAWAVKTADLFEEGDTVEHPHGSGLVLFESGVPLGPAHSDHVSIRELGGGRFSHWGEWLYFSSSENLPPNQMRVPTCCAARRRRNRAAICGSQLADRTGWAGYDGSIRYKSARAQSSYPCLMTKAKRGNDGLCQFFRNRDFSRTLLNRSPMPKLPPPRRLQPPLPRRLAVAAAEQAAAVAAAEEGAAAAAEQAAAAAKEAAAVAAAAYANAVANDYSTALHERDIKFEGYSLLEIGPGRNLLHVFALKALGLDIGIADRFLATWEDFDERAATLFFERLWPDFRQTIIDAMSAGGYPFRMYAEPAEDMRSIGASSFDAVFSDATLEHFYDLPAVARELYRVTKLNG